MAIFKNTRSSTCKVSFNGIRFPFDGETEVNDKDFIEFLKSAPDFILVSKEESNEDNNQSIEELKKQADELGLKYHPNIGFDKLKSKIEKETE